MARLAFFGTPDFAAVSLHKLNLFCKDYNHDLVMIVTKPDQPQGRGKKLQAPVVKILAQELNLPVYQPSTLRKNTPDGDKFYQDFLALKIDLAIVVAYGQIITSRLLLASQLGFINIHGSLLPKFRGAAPIQRAIISGDHETGVCLMSMNTKLDEGDIFIQEATPIIPSDTTETLFRRLANLGAYILCKNLPDLLNQKIKKNPQSQNNITYASMINKTEGLINFSNSGQVIHNKLRAFDPWPRLYGFINNSRVIFFNSFFIKTNTHKNITPGTIVCLNKFLGVKTHDGILYFQAIQPENKKILPIEQACLGLNIKLGDVISGQLEH